jgi:hypothetical protein
VLEKGAELRFGGHYRVTVEELPAAVRQAG